MSNGDQRDPTLKGLGRRMTEVEDTLVPMQESLGKIVTFAHRIQWTFTGLVIYYIIDNQGLAGLIKVIAKGVIGI